MDDCGEEADRKWKSDSCPGRERVLTLFPMLPPLRSTPGYSTVPVRFQRHLALGGRFAQIVDHASDRRALSTSDGHWNAPLSQQLGGSSGFEQPKERQNCARSREHLGVTH